MNTVKVSKTELLNKLKENRSKHTELYKEAAEGYRNTVIEQLEKNLALAKDGGEIRTAINLQAPQNHTEDYDNIIAQLEMSVDTVIELESHDFQSYVMDKWQWAKAAMFLNSTYAAASKKFM